MYSELIPKINEGIIKNKKVIVTIGCSFVEGQGALDQYLWDTYWREGVVNTAKDWVFSAEQKAEITKLFPDIFYNNHYQKLNFYVHESNNSFGSILCKKYFENQYTHINLGRRGCGNKSSIKDLYFYPDILWDSIEEIIVIYCPTSAERYDFIDDTHSYNYLNGVGRWVAIWPGGYEKPPPYTENSEPKNIISYGLNQAVYSFKSSVIEQITHVQELLLWCKYKKAKLIITPAFTGHFYTQDQFGKYLNTNIKRNFYCEKISEKPLDLDQKLVDKFTNLWPWDSMFYPDNNMSLSDLAMSQESDIKIRSVFFYEFMGKGTPDKWITPCAHLSVKAHDLFAKHLYKHIISL